MEYVDVKVIRITRYITIDIIIIFFRSTYLGLCLVFYYIFF